MESNHHRLVKGQLLDLRATIPKLVLRDRVERSISALRMRRIAGNAYRAIGAYSANRTLFRRLTRTGFTSKVY